MKPERVQVEDESPRPFLSHRLEFDSIGQAASFVGQVGDLADDSLSLDIELRDLVVTVRLGSQASEPSPRETAFMERVRGIA